jgi:DNA polymerase/3'-5' exonuclease PolX
LLSLIHSLLALQEEERKPDFNPFKLNAFSKAIESILAVDWPIRSGNDVHAVSREISAVGEFWLLTIIQIQGIGPGIVKRINDHLLRQYVDDVEADSDRGEFEICLFLCQISHSAKSASYDQMMKSQVATTLQTVPGIG